MVLIFVGYFTAFRKKVAEYGGLQVVKAYRIYNFLIFPFWWQKVVMLYNPESKKYFNFDNSKLEKTLLKIESDKPEDYINAIKRQEREEKKKIEFAMKHAAEREKELDDNFILFLKIALSVIFLFVIYGVIKFIVTGRIL